VEPVETLSLAKHIQDNCPGLQLVGLMTIGAIARSKDAENPNEDFLTLKKVRDEIWKPLGRSSPEDLELSMGMSEDYEQAIELGATTVRVGSTIFGLRPKKADVAAKASTEETKA
jgi:PLP dependent protein